MVLDNIKNIGLYEELGGNFSLAIETLKKIDVASTEKEKWHDVNGGDVRYSVQLVEGKMPDSEMYEAHRKYADIQFVKKGLEHIGWANSGRLERRKEYDDKSDIEWFRGEGQMLRVDEGEFCIFFPEDAHMPCRNDGVNPCSSTKIVIKVRIG